MGNGLHQNITTLALKSGCLGDSSYTFPRSSGWFQRAAAAEMAALWKRCAAVSGRYVNLYIAATMHSLKLCADDISRKSAKQSWHGSL
jgi:hypothetical protein